MTTRICIFGASITWGIRDNEGGGWSCRLRNYFETNNYDVRVFNLGIPGDTTADLLKRFNVECAARKPELVIFGLGGNDACYINTDTDDNMVVPLKQFQNNFSELINQAKKFTGKIILVGLTKVDESKTMPLPRNKVKFCSNDNIVKYDSAMKNISDINGLSFVSLLDSLTVEDLSDDGRHPNTNGHKKMFLRVKEFLLANKLIQ